MRDRHPLSLSSLALRAGWGKQGNQSIQPYQTLLLLRSDPNALYPFGGTITSGLAATQVGNPNLKWETATQTNLGLDLGFSSHSHFSAAFRQAYGRSPSEFRQSALHR